jgi:hypothetical protein
MNEDGLGIKSSEKTIQEHIRHYYTALNSGQEFTISSLFDYYRQSRPSLHKLINDPGLDISTLCYSLSRQPLLIIKTDKIIIVKDPEQLVQMGVNISALELVSAPSRRRQNYYDRIQKILYILITSDSDIDDLINTLIAIQVERQKLSAYKPNDLNLLLNQENYSLIGLDENGWKKLKDIFGPDWKENLNSFSEYSDVIVRYLPAPDTFYQKSASTWWQQVTLSSLIFQFKQTPLYFASSNLHSFANLIGGYVNQEQDRIIFYIEKHHPDLYRQWLELKNGQNQLRVIDFLYYISAKYFHDLPSEAKAKISFEESLGIKNIRPKTQVPCNVQLIPISAIAKSINKDRNLIIPNTEKLLNSTTYLLNIEYPLGQGAYYLMKEILSTLEQLKGIYIIGKAAILSGSIGDVQIPKIVFDERSNNIFYPDNVFNSYFPSTVFQSSILKDQKAISVYGTFLENQTQLENYISSGFNIIEMETGPYLTALYQHFSQLSELPHDTVAHLDQLPYDLGIINYASDNPLTQTLGDSVMSLKGIEPTYLASLSVLQRIIDLESA